MQWFTRATFCRDRPKLPSLPYHNTYVSVVSERALAGVKAAQRRGAKFGRKPKLTA
jgi:hypothetical protein